MLVIMGTLRKVHDLISPAQITHRDPTNHCCKTALEML